MGTMKNDQIGVMPYEKELNVLAMKVSLKDVEERFIRFQNPEFLNKKSEIEAISLKKLAYLRQTNSFEGEGFLKSQEMVDLYSLTRQSFSWKPGTYYLDIFLESPDEFTILDDQYSFILTPLQVQQLAGNLNFIESYYANEVIPPEESKEPKAINMSWVYPQMKPVRA